MQSQTNTFLNRTTGKILLPFILAAIGAGSATLISSCGKGVLGGTTAAISFKNGTATASNGIFKMLQILPEAWATNSTGVGPYFYSVKFLSAYLAEDINADTQNNVGNVEKIYVNTQCGDDCGSTNQVTTFFELTRPAAEVNADINGQRRIVTPGTFKYVRLDFCIGSGNQNVKWQVAAADPVYIDDSNNCGRSSAEMVPPLTIAAGDQVTISMNYTIDGTMITTCSSSTHCDTTGHSVQFPAMTPTATKE